MDSKSKSKARLYRIDKQYGKVYELVGNSYEFFVSFFTLGVNHRSTLAEIARKTETFRLQREGGR